MEHKNVPLVIVGVICALSLIVMIIVLALPDKAKTLSFTPPQFDVDAVQGKPVVPQNLGWSEVDVKAYKASVCGVVSLDTDRADVWFTNPKSNDVWLKLRVLDSRGRILGETGLIKPGEYVQKIIFTRIPKNDEMIRLKLMAYEPETYYSAGCAVLSTKVKVEE